MQNAKPLPTYLVQRYHGWKATTYAENQSWYRRLATEGQRPRAMVISCCKLAGSCDLDLRRRSG